MIVTTRTETFIKVEMTEAQADLIALFLRALQERHIIEVSKMIGIKNVSDRVYNELVDALNDLKESLKDAP